MSNRARGEKRALNTFVSDLIENGLNGNRVEIGHVNNEPLAEVVANKIKEKLPNANIHITLASGLCSFYAEDGGLIVGYERN